MHRMCFSLEAFLHTPAVRANQVVLCLCMLFHVCSVSVLCVYVLLPACLPAPFLMVQQPNHPMLGLLTSNVFPMQSCAYSLSEAQWCMSGGRFGLVWLVSIT